MISEDDWKGCALSSNQGSLADFVDLVKAMGEAKSKVEEENIILSEIESLEP